MINRVGILGLGALGAMYGSFLTQKLGKENVFVLGDRNRIDKYSENGVFVNDVKVDFNYSQKVEKLDLIIVATKFHHLKAAIENMKKHIDDNTIIISLLNGVSSEEVIKQNLGKGRIVYCVAYGMDSQKYGNKIIFNNYGTLAIGNKEDTKALNELKDFFEKVGIKYEIPNDIFNKIWSKFMLNVGINQVCAAYGLHYGDVKKQGEYRSKMISAMKEVLKIAEKINVPISDEDISYWLKVIDTLSSDSMPSMAQDISNKNKTEVEIFADTVVDLGKKYSIDTPVNIELGKIIHEKENKYEL